MNYQQLKLHYRWVFDRIFREGAREGWRRREEALAEGFTEPGAPPPEEFTTEDPPWS